MRIVLSGEGSRGDIYPLLDLGSQFLAAGHDVLLCAPPDFASAASARNLSFRAVGVSVREFLTQRAGAVAGNGFSILREAGRFTAGCLEWQFRELPDAVRGADLVLAGGVQFSAGSAAQLHGIPYRYIAYCPGLLPSAHHTPAFFPTQWASPRANRWAWGATMAIFNHPLRRILNRHRRQLGLPAVDDALRLVLSPRPILAVDPCLAETPTDLGFPVQQIPCLHASNTDPLPEKLEAFLDRGPSPVYLGFGSMTDPTPEATTRKMLDAIERAGCRAVISEGWGGLGGVPLPENVMTIGSVSHTQLFPRCAAIVHHGGAGTTTSAARAGTPQILVPHLMDQFYWAQRVTRLGIGVQSAKRSRFTAETLSESLSAVLDNELLSERAKTIAQRSTRDRAALPSIDRLLLTG